MANILFEKKAIDEAFGNAGLWNTFDFIEESTAMRGLLSKRLIDNSSTEGQTAFGMLYGPLGHGIQERIPFGYMSPSYRESGTLTLDESNKLTARTHTYGTSYCKPILLSDTVGIIKGFTDIHQALELERKILNQDLPNYWGKELWYITASIVKSIVKIPELVLGTPNDELSVNTIDKLRRKWEEDDALPPAYMNFNTLLTIKGKQEGDNPAIKSKMIVESHGQVVLTGPADSYTTTVGGKHNYIFMGSTPVIVDKQIPDGVILFIRDNSLCVTLRDFEGSTKRIVDEEADNNFGFIKYLTKMAALIHPKGLSFEGVKGKDYDESGKPTQAEWEGGLFKFIGNDYSRSNFFAVKLKMT